MHFTERVLIKMYFQIKSSLSLIPVGKITLKGTWRKRFDLQIKNFIFPILMFQFNQIIQESDERDHIYFLNKKGKTP